VSTDIAGIRICPAARNDIPALVTCATTLASETEEVGFGEAWSERTFTDSGRLLAAWREPNRVGTQETFVAEIEGSVVGSVTAEDRDEELELINVDAPRDHQGRGIGSCLVRFVEECARREGKHAVTLGTSRNAAGVPWKSFPW
jgi:predicted N-acetyltransferase YhbS